MSSRERPAPVQAEFDALIRCTVRASVAHRQPAAGVRRQLIERISEQHSLVRPRLSVLSVLEWLDCFLSTYSVWNDRPYETRLCIDNFYLIGAYRINWRWCM